MGVATINSAIGIRPSFQRIIPDPAVRLVFRNGKGGLQGRQYDASLGNAKVILYPIIITTGKYGTGYKSQPVISLRCQVHATCQPVEGSRLDDALLGQIIQGDIMLRLLRAAGNG